MALKNAALSGFFYGLSQFIIFMIIAIVFYCGALFVKNNDVLLKNMFTAMFSVFFAAIITGNNSHVLPDLGECKISAANLFLLLDNKDED